MEQQTSNVFDHFLDSFSIPSAPIYWLVLAFHVGVQLLFLLFSCFAGDISCFAGSILGQYQSTHPNTVV